jgi:alkylhydroperoxidase family enzyme
MRLPYVANPPVTSNAGDAEIVARIAARRHPRPLQPLDLTLLHSPLVADGWNSFLGAVRTKTDIPADERELAISRIAAINRAWYEWRHHAPLAVQAGVDEALMMGVVVDGAVELNLGDKAPGFNDRQWLALVYADEMTRNVQVKDDTFEALKQAFSDREVVELTATVSYTHLLRIYEDQDC